MIPLRIRAALAAASLTVLAFPAPAQAEPGVYHLNLTVTDQSGRTTARAELDCHPVGGSHPMAAEACQALDRVDGDPSRLTPQAGVDCYQLYRPVTGSATGEWNGWPVRWQMESGNDCKLRVATYPVFSF
ncbi:SSI family serine proteinase inhibitor [Kitasatospora sp. NPDC052896]|uniref:SSI family serine proteinase inhibitor n=1 Tax=Kitasatospora sp. NPDC052896 TaxID=3364061 RepID=UPI0037C8E37B